MLLKPYHLFAHKGITYLLNIEEMEGYEIDENTSMALHEISLDPHFTLTPKMEEKLERLKMVAPVCQAEKKRATSKPNLAPVRNITLFITQKCTLRCTYCYGNGGNYGSYGHMKYRTAKRAVDWLIEQSGVVKILGIAFFGGEPFLNFSLMKEVVAYAQKRGEMTGKEFKFSVTTNASLLDEDKITFLKENKVKPLVSFDGSKDVQDAQRPFRNGGGSYEAIVPKISQLLQIFPEVTARATLVGQTDPDEVIRALHEIGFSSTHITFASPSLFSVENKRNGKTRNNQGMALMMEAEAEELLKNIKSCNTENLKKQKVNGHLVTRLGEFLNNQKKYFGCGAGRAFVGVSNIGDVFLCHRFVGTEGYRLGNIFDKELERDVYQESPIKLAKECYICFAKYICGGGCYHENLGATGLLIEPSESYCRMMQRLAELVAYVSSQLNEKDRIYMAKEKIIPRNPCLFDFPE